MTDNNRYLDAKTLININDACQMLRPVTDHDKFTETIRSREEMCKIIDEHVKYLSYDLNPIGGRTDMFNAMNKNAMEEIITIRALLDDMVASLMDCCQQK